MHDQKVTEKWPQTEHNAEMPDHKTGRKAFTQGNYI